MLGRTGRNGEPYGRHAVFTEFSHPTGNSSDPSDPDFDRSRVRRAFHVVIPEHANRLAPLEQPSRTRRVHGVRVAGMKRAERTGIDPADRRVVARSNLRSADLTILGETRSDHEFLDASL